MNTRYIYLELKPNHKYISWQVPTVRIEMVIGRLCCLRQTQHSLSDKKINPLSLDRAVAYLPILDPCPENG